MSPPDSHQPGGGASRPATDDPVLTELLDVLDPAVVVVDPDVMAAYAADRAGSLTPGVPRAVVRACSTHDVAATLTVAHRHGIPVVTRGLGTGLSGGSTAISGCITLSTEAMRSLRVDPAAMLVEVGPGLRNAEVKEAAAAHGLWYPPDPSSFEICSIGGNLATNAGGLCCVKYGVTTDYVLGLEVVLADGTIARLGGRTIKDAAGYDLKRLFVGSEGTLGVITSATLRLRTPPPPATTVVATFDSVTAAGDAVVALLARTAPSMLELMDAAAIRAVEQVRPMDLDTSAAALLLTRLDSGEPADTAAVTAACSDAGATYVAATDDADEGELLMGARRMAIPCVERLGTVLIEDIGVPIPRIPELLAGTERISERHRTLVPVIGHAGDGNFHPLVTYDSADPEATSRAHAAFEEIMELAVSLGGTITGEHGVGLLKAGQLRAQVGDDVMALHHRIKDALDPRGILNPGKWV